MRTIKTILLTFSITIFSSPSFAGNIADPNDPNYDANKDPCYDLRRPVSWAKSKMKRIAADIRREMDNIKRSDDAKAAGLRASADAAMDAFDAAVDGATSAASGSARGFGEAVSNLTIAVGNFLPGVSGVDLSHHAKIRLQKLSDELVETNEAAGAAQAALDECEDSYEFDETSNDDGNGLLISGDEGSAGSGVGGPGASGSGSDGHGNGSHNSGGDNNSRGDQSGGSVVKPNWGEIKNFSKDEVQNAISWINREIDTCQQFPASEIGGCVTATVKYLPRLRSHVNKSVSGSADATDRLDWVQMKRTIDTTNTRADQVRGR